MPTSSTGHLFLFIKSYSFWKQGETSMQISTKQYSLSGIKLCKTAQFDCGEELYAASDDVHHIGSKKSIAMAYTSCNRNSDRGINNKRWTWYTETNYFHKTSCSCLSINCPIFSRRISLRLNFNGSCVSSPTRRLYRKILVSIYIYRNVLFHCECS